jgi:hypothetical protein
MGIIEDTKATIERVRSYGKGRDPLTIVWRLIKS